MKRVDKSYRRIRNSILRKLSPTYKKVDKLSAIAKNQHAIIGDFTDNVNTKLHGIVNKLNDLVDSIEIIKQTHESLTTIQSGLSSRSEIQNQLISEIIAQVELGKKLIENLDSVSHDTYSHFRATLNGITAKLDKSSNFLYNGLNWWEFSYLKPLLPQLKNIELTEKFPPLLNGLDNESRQTVVKIVNRIRSIDTSNKEYDLFTSHENNQLRLLKDEFSSSVVQLNPNLYYYDGMYLPIMHFKASVFYYQHGLHHVIHPERFRNKDIIDGGGFIGDSLLQLCTLTDKKVYSFEPAKSNFTSMQRTIALNNINNAVPVQLALGEESNTASLNVAGSMSSLFDLHMAIFGKTESESIAIDTLDNFVKKQDLDVGLIKIDIAGSEQPCLRGAVQTIAHFRPTLLISINHDFNDFFEIKPMIESWGLGYKFKIYKPIDGAIFLDTILIAESI